MKRITRRKTGRLQRERGVAIITVLSVLMLITVMVISFFTMATSDLAASRGNAEGLRAVAAKDIAINLAIAQIREATTREGTTWVSQPGAIRLYGLDDRTGRAASIYKLYSASTMVARSMNDIERDLPRTWDKETARFVDMNRPVISPDPSDPENIVRASIHFPIVDPRAYIAEGQQGSIEGFSYTSQRINGIVGGGTDNLKRLPMPVSWLYVLADGAVGYLDSQNKFVGQVQPTEDNPIVSRVAFWTDDDTCKVNVNTASEGVYWDTPHVDTVEDREYARFQPQTGEYQRYPGHPAMTCLSTVLFPNQGSHPDSEAKRLDPKRDREIFEALWTLTPGIGTGGTKGGTTTVADVSAGAMTATPEDYHLYASPEEILFSPAMNGAQRRLNELITPEKLEHSRFFLTPRSRAPEITILGEPRMTVWPVPANTSNRTPFDKVIAFCSTINNGQYFFQRESAYSRHNEFYTHAGGRNEILYEYYKTITNSALPGFGGSFGNKYGKGRFDDRDNLVAETIDYFRGTNLYDGNNRRWQYTNGGKTDTTIGHGQIAPICLCGGTGPHVDRWANVRLALPKGFGRMIGLSEISLFAILRAERKSTTEFVGASADITRYDLQPGQKLVQLGFMVEAFAPAHGWTSLQPQNALAFGGGQGNRNDRPPSGLTLNGQPLRWASGSKRNDAANFVQTSTRRPENWVSWGGYSGVRVFENMLSFEPVVVDAASMSLQFSGSTASDPLRLILFDERITSFDVNQLIQSYQLAFPPATFPMPNWWHPEGGTSRENSLEERMKAAIRNGVDKLYSPSADVIQSLVPSHGDYRIITSKRVIGTESFVPHPDYGSTRMAHSLTDYTDSKLGVQALPGATFYGELLKGIHYPKHLRPDFPIGPENEAFAQDIDPRSEKRRQPYDPETTGDFDTGVGNAQDGPYINRPDDGDARGLFSGSGDPYFDNNRDRRDLAASTFAPNRIIPGPGMLGSLSTGVQDNVPWQTLLFRPMDRKKHYGATDPPDHLWMDMFWMPVVQPYVISEPFSTAGKINMNYQILPFTYIRRATGLHAVMKAEKMLAIPNGEADRYKDGAGHVRWRKFIDIGETLKQWDEKFAKGEAFRSATEICDMYLVPEGERWRGRNAMEKFWEDHKLTGDNVKERPYTNLYPRLTVKSNTFTVHVFAQSITKVKGTAPDTFDLTRDKIAGEYRGSAVIERTIDPNDPDIPDYARESHRGNDTERLDRFYTYRVVDAKRFAP